jgi:hypothetical protein
MPCTRSRRRKIARRSGYFTHILATQQQDEEGGTFNFLQIASCREAIDQVV